MINQLHIYIYIYICNYIYRYTHTHIYIYIFIYTCSPVDVTIVVHIDNGYLFLSFHKIHVYPRGFTFMRILERFFTFMNGFSRSAHQAQFSYSKTIKKCFKMHATFTKRHLKRCPILQPQHSQSLLHNHPRPLAFVTPG